MVCGDKTNWVLDWESKELENICNNLGILTVKPQYVELTDSQSVFYSSRYNVLQNWEKPKNRIAFPYFHGKPGYGFGFKKMIKTIKSHHNYIDRIQVSHSEIHDLILETGIDVNKVFRIPIGINCNYFIKWKNQIDTLLIAVV